MAENQDDIPPVFVEISGENPDSVQDPAAPPTSAEENLELEELETFRESKRRKYCPAALEKFEELDSSSRSFSFSFDTKIMVGSCESTPKFGSFNLAGDLGLETARTPEDEDGVGNCDGISPGFLENEAEEEETTQIVKDGCNPVDESKAEGSSPVEGIKAVD
uniref:Uncharacterized protein n=1 Tax=Nelumbo nucifera TaxID=4432 RepID=A0A822YD06_NELNU|nr:TPA_asm: hypothetical protein HUJ06_030647 [Nelumbo nucifera]